MSRKSGLGFNNGYITLLKGDQTLYEDYLRASAARYNLTFGWYFASTDEIPEDLPSGLVPVRLEEDKYFQPNSDEILPSKTVEENINKLIYDESPSEYFGAINMRYDLTLTVLKKLSTNSTFGTSYLYIFQDKDMNIFTWKTTANSTLEEGKIYTCRATIKNHTVYKNTKQTELTRAMSFKLLAEI